MLAQSVHADISSQEQEFINPEADDKS